MQKLKVKKLKPQAKLPTKGTEHSAGYDLYLAEDLDLAIPMDGSMEDVVVLAKFGISVEIPEGYVGLIFERSSSHKMNISLMNKVGVIDSDYRGELMAPIQGGWWEDEGETIRNLVEQGKYHRAGTRIAQLVIVPCFSGEVEEVKSLEETERGDGGFGSTGVGEEAA